MGFEHVSSEKKMSFLKNVKPRKPLYSCSRMRVGEGAPKEEGTDKFRSLRLKTDESLSRKSRAENYEKCMKHLP